MILFLIVKCPNKLCKLSTKCLCDLSSDSIAQHLNMYNREFKTVTIQISLSMFTITHRVLLIIDDWQLSSYIKSKKISIFLMFNK